MKAKEYAQKEPAFASATAGLFLIGGLSIFEILNGPDLSLELFYLLPVGIASWFAGRRPGLFMAAAAALGWLAADLFSRSAQSFGFLDLWNGLTHWGFLLAFAWTLPAFREEWQQIKEAAQMDYLTRTANKKGFLQLAEAELDRAQRYRHPFTLSVLDVDNFKFVNERYGHNSGDTLLRAVAQTIQGKIRSTDRVARIGGDEFALLLPETQSDAARVVLRRIQKHLLDLAERNEWPVTFSIGAATFTQPPISVDEMMDRALALLEEVKSQGRNGVRHEVVGSLSGES